MGNSGAAAGRIPGNLTPLVGREEELRRIDDYLTRSDCRLLTLVGPGGIGKTRLAFESARAARQDAFPHGIYCVLLQQLTSYETIVSAIADALSHPFQAGQDPKAQLLHHLQGRTLLLVLDNFEHLVAGAELLSEILAAAPGVKLLVTSRERLRLVEEWVFDVDGLQVPELDTAPDFERYSAVRLFTLQATRVAASFQYHAASAPAVIRICRLVGGMPLAIELAAVWARALSPEQIAVELEQSLDILESPARNALPRHRTMRAVIEPAWNRLSEEERQVFRKLSVFRGGFTREAAEQVAGATISGLAELVDKSMLRLNSNARYDLHELLRQFAAEQLRFEGEDEAMFATHSRYYADYLQQRLADLKGRRQIPAMMEINTDFENIRTAWNFAARHRLEPVIGAMINALEVFCSLRERDAEGLALFQFAERQFAPAPGEVPTRLWGQLLSRAAGGETGKAPAERALAIARQHEDWPEIAYCLEVLGTEASKEGDRDATKAFLTQSLEIYRRLGDRFAVAGVLFRLQGTSRNEAWEDFSRYGEESLTISRAIGDRVGAAWTLSSVAINRMREGNFVQSEQLWLERIALGYEIGNLNLAATGLGQLSHKVYFYTGDFERARASALEALQLASRLDRSNAVYWAQATLALLASMEEDYQESTRLCKLVIAAAGKSWMADLATWALSIAACGHGDFDAAREYFHLSSQLHVTIHGLPGIVGCFPVAAAILAHRGQLVRATELLALAFTHPIGASGWMEKWPLLARLRADLERSIGMEAYRAAWARGTHLDAESVFTEVREHFRIACPAAPAVPAVATPVLDEPLTWREVEILRLIADGSSNREVAERLYLSVETIRWYLKQIYDKLDAHSRVQAITRARALKLLL